MANIPQFRLLTPSAPATTDAFVRSFSYKKTDPATGSSPTAASSQAIGRIHKEQGLPAQFREREQTETPASYRPARQISTA